jgi:hypothetical protein
MNLDQLCAEYGYRFAEQINQVLPNRVEPLLTKALSVLQEQGLYAFVLFCESRGSTEKQGADKIKELTEELIKDKLNLISNNNLLEEIRKDNGLASNLDNLMLAIQVLEKSLIYARYHAKAFKESPQTNQEANGA